MTHCPLTGSGGGLPGQSGSQHNRADHHDGEESCGGDPCAVSAKLQASGFVMKPYGGRVRPHRKRAALVRCIGEYYSASDTASLRQVLSTIMAALWRPLR